MAPSAARPAAEHPLGHGNAKVTVTNTVLHPKRTIERSAVEGTLETVQLCAPAVMRDQFLEGSLRVRPDP
jgi:hypothetical protein